MWRIVMPGINIIPFVKIFLYKNNIIINKNKGVNMNSTLVGFAALSPPLSPAGQHSCTTFKPIRWARWRMLRVWSP